MMRDFFLFTVFISCSGQEHSPNMPYQSRLEHFREKSFIIIVVTCYQWFLQCQVMPGGGGGLALLPYLGYIGMCGPKGYCFSAILVINRIWFLYSSLDMGMFFIRSHFFIIIKRKMVMVMVIVSILNIVLPFVSIITI